MLELSYWNNTTLENDFGNVFRNKMCFIGCILSVRCRVADDHAVDQYYNKCKDV